MLRIKSRVITGLAFAVASLAPAMAMAQEEAATKAKTLSVFEMFFYSDDPLGLIITWSLILMSVGVMALAILAILKNRRTNMMPDDLVDELTEMIEERRFREAIEVAAEDESAFGVIIHAGLSEASSGYPAMQRAVEEAADAASAVRVRSLALLDVLGAVGPMLGLFGTVYGMIVSFQKLVESGGTPDPGKLAGGISTALVTTFWGLVVGIPAVAVSTLMKSRIDGLITDSMIQAEELVKQFKPAGGGSKKPAARSTSGGGAPKPKLS